MTEILRSSTRRRWLRLAGGGGVALAAGGLLGACQRRTATVFHATDIRDTNIGQGWALPDASGQMRTIADYKGKVVAVFFGFIHCPDICPTTMAELAQVRERLGDQADRLQVLFVTVDPERDTPEILSSYLQAFDPTAQGLRGNAEQLAAAAQTFKVFYAKVPQGEGNYTMDHSSGLYVFDGEGRIRLYSRYGQPVDQLAADIRQLIQGS